MVSKIEWTGPTLNTLAGCTPQGPECDHCYADDECHRFHKAYEGRPGLVVIRGPAKKPGLTWLPKDADGRSLKKGAKWTGEMRCLPHKMLGPLSTTKGDYWFVNSVSDLFHETLVGDEHGFNFIAANFGLFAVTPNHRFQILTKQPKSAVAFFEKLTSLASEQGMSVTTYCVLVLLMELRRAAMVCIGTKHESTFRKAAREVDQRWKLRGKSHRDMVSKRRRLHGVALIRDRWPLSNVHLGVSVGLAETKHRIDSLREMEAAVRFVSFEPMLADLGELDLTGIDWAIFGGESGQHARPCELEWIERGVAEAQAQNVRVFVKQLGARPHYKGEPWLINDVKGAILDDWPKHLRIRDMPEE